MAVSQFVPEVYNLVRTQADVNAPSFTAQTPFMRWDSASQTFVGSAPVGVPDARLDSGTSSAQLVAWDDAAQRYKPIPNSYTDTNGTVHLVALYTQYGFSTYDISSPSGVFGIRHGGTNTAFTFGPNVAAPGRFVMGFPSFDYFGPTDAYLWREGPQFLKSDSTFECVGFRSFKNTSTGVVRFFQNVPNTAPTDAAISIGEMSAWVDEGAAKLKFRVRCSDGSYKTAEVTLQ